MFGLCDVMARNWSHVTLHKRAENCFYLIMSKYVYFCIHQKEIICLSFCHLNGFSTFFVRF